VSETAIPDGYIIGTVGQYPDLLTDRASGRDYKISVQLINCETGDMPRGVGMTYGEAVAHAITNVGGDDGLSKAFREIFQGPTQ
jgi:hypothetical protein